MTRHLRLPVPASLAALALLAPASVATLHALVEFPGDRITLQTTASETYDSYMIGTRDHSGDSITSVQPQLTYKHLVGPTNLTVYGGMAFNRYASETQFNSDDFSAGLTSNFPTLEGSRLTGNAAAAYIESTNIDQILNDRIPTKTYSGNFNAQYKLGLKTTVTDAIDYNRSERKLYGNQTLWSNHAGFVYADFLEDTNLNLGHTYSRTNSTASNYALWAYDPTLIGSTPDSKLDQTGNTFSAGLTHPIYGDIIGGATYGYSILHRQSSETTAGDTTERSSVFSLSVDGPFLPPSRFPKVKSSASLSYSQSQTPGINDSGQKTITGQASLSWQARERTQVAFDASRSTSLGSNNFTVVSSQVGMEINETIGLATSAAFTSRYTWRSIRGLNRNDTVLNLGLNLKHPLNQYWTIGASYTFERDDTDAKTTDFVATRYPLEKYTRHVVSAFVSFSY